MYIDAHNHMDFYKENLNKAICEINENRIITLANSMDIESYLLNKELSKESKFIIPTFGIHPWKANEYKGELEMLLPYIIESKLIGEIGLDFHWINDKETYSKQREVFDFILRESAKRNKFVTIHTKGAEEEIYYKLKELNYNKVIVHWYSGELETLERFIELGCYFTISVDIGYSKLTNEIVKRLPLNRILTETDGPTALEWVNGKYGYPSEVISVVDKIAKIRSIHIEVLNEIINDNFKDICKGICKGI